MTLIIEKPLDLGGPFVRAAEKFRTPRAIIEAAENPEVMKNLNAAEYLVVQKGYSFLARIGALISR